MAGRRRQSREPKATNDAPSKGPRKRRRAWVKDLDVCGQSFIVEAFFRDKKGVNHRGYQGQCTVADGLIEALIEENPGATYDTLLHEIIHALFTNTALEWTIEQLFPELSKKKRALLQETVCRFLAPGLLATFTRARWLQLPKLPTRQRHRSAK